ncbi:hypothetical protein [Methylomonas sp. LWB]|uniref:hypothetical protein n=1 Tax=Methylomonas sp. LWB TaxID=1905845 RepID=UPI00111533D1|nr:hypothetical protein [Methylomonas sp. LWB]
MSKYLYFKTAKFESNQDFANWLHQELCRAGEVAGVPINDEFMFVIPVTRGTGKGEIYLGKNEEQSNPPLWQVWFENKVGFFKKLFLKPSTDNEQHYKNLLFRLVGSIDGVSNVEWSDI